MSHPFSDERAASSATLAGRLRAAATVIRRHAGSLTYHPAARQTPTASSDLEAAFAEVERLVREIREGATERTADEGAPGAANAAEPLRRAHADLDRTAEAVVSTLAVLRGMLGAPDEASLDAPYGRGAPRRHHPGALCTILAERLEYLAHVLQTSTILKANLYRPRNLMPG